MTAKLENNSHRQQPIAHLGLLTASLGLALGACGVGSVDMGSNNSQMTWEEFRDGTYKEPWENGVYVLNGDEVLVDERQLEQYYLAVHGSGDALIVNTAFGQDTVWNAQQRNALTYCINDNFAGQKQAIIQAMANATAAWQNAADVTFNYVAAEDANCTPNNNNVVFDVAMVAGQPYLARAFFPNQNRNTRNVLVDESSFGNLGAITLEGILKHELGHVLGFRHEHTRPESGATQCFEDNNWRELTEYDQLSVMHYPQCNGVAGRDLALTALDIEGAKSLYGAPGAGTPDPNDPPIVGTPQTGTASGELARSEVAEFEPMAVVPNTVFTARMTGQGDADLYVRFNQAPTATAFDCRPYLVGSIETCAIDVPANATSVYIMVDGFTASTYNLEVNWMAPQ